MEFGSNPDCTDVDYQLSWNYTRQLLSDIQPFKTGMFWHVSVFVQPDWETYDRTEEKLINHAC